MTTLVRKHEHYLKNKLFWVLVVITALMLIMVVFPPKVQPALNLGIDLIKPAINAYANGEILITPGSIRGGNEFTTTGLRY